MSNTLDLVKDELKKRLKKKKIGDFDNLDLTVVENLIHDEGLLLLDEFKDKITTPVGLANYFDASVKQNNNIDIVKRDLDTLFNKDKVSYTTLYDFSRKVIIFSKHPEIDSVPKSFTIVYTIDIDENDNKVVRYSLSTTNSIWNWNITKGQLKALAESTVLYPEDILQNKKFTWKQRLKVLFTGWIK